MKEKLAEVYRQKEIAAEVEVASTEIEKTAETLGSVSEFSTDKRVSYENRRYGRTR